VKRAPTKAGTRIPPVALRTRRVEQDGPQGMTRVTDVLFGERLSKTLNFR
jgi:hypothetical protein